MDVFYGKVREEFAKFGGKKKFYERDLAPPRLF